MFGDGGNAVGLSFCAIDFETANLERGSPCAVGLVRVEDGHKVASTRWLMRPPEDVDWFDEFNVMLHGISEADVRDQPRFVDRLPEILMFGGGLPFVAHNAAFDMGVIRDACEWSGLDEWPPAIYLCTMIVARRTWPELPSYSLPWVLEAAGGSLDHHHDPLADARAAADILIAEAAHHEAGSIDELADKAYVLLGSMRGAEWQGSHAEGLSRQPLPGANPDAEPGHPFFGREIAFTGALIAMVRRVAEQKVAELGGQPARDVTHATSVLVTGYQDPRKLTHGGGLSRKAQKAADLKAAGQDIEIVPEEDFIQLLKM